MTRRLLALARDSRLALAMTILAGFLAGLLIIGQASTLSQAMARVFVLRDSLGVRIGSAVVFHPAESLDALPHGETGESEGVEASQTEVEDRLETVFADFTSGGLPFGGAG